MRHMHPITSQCPKMKNAYAQRWAEKGFAAGAAGKPLAVLDDEADPSFEDTTWQPGARMAWIRGWEFAGGDIHTKVVVTQRERWEQERAELRERLAWLDEQLTQGKPDDR